MRHFILGLFLISSAAFAEYPAVIDPVATATPPGASVSAGYLTLKNNSEQTISITEVYSPTIPKVEIHLSSVVNDVAKMEKQELVEIPAGESLTFEHGSYHIMFMGLTTPLKEDNVIDVILVTSAGDMLIEMPVKKITSGRGHETGLEKIDPSKLADGKSEHGTMDHSTMDHGTKDDATMEGDKMDADKMAKPE